MIVGADATFLLYFFAPAGSVGTPLDSTGQPIDLARERVEALVRDLEKASATIIVATPALGELMVRAGVQAAQTWIAIMNRSTPFKIVPFDVKSAIEVAIMAGNAITGDGLKKSTTGTHAKLKYDRQIVAIAHSEGATTFYTDDEDQGKLAARLGMTVRGLADCPIPPELAQHSMNFEVNDEEEPEV